MLPIKSLDDEQFEEITLRARNLIKKYYPQWTDYNLHDPGITFIELFAWLKEIQQYHLDQISLKSRKKFLKLLGFAPQTKKPANSLVRIFQVGDDLELLLGTRFRAGQICFESLQHEFITKSKIAGGFFLSTTGFKSNFSSYLSAGGKMQFYIFGLEPEVGGAFYLAVDRAFPPGKIINLYFDVYDDYEVKRNAPGPDFVPLAELYWEYYSCDGWQPLEVIKDDTHQFIQTGRISFTFQKEMDFASLPEEGYWLRAALKISNYEVAPILNGVYLNALPVIQKETYSTYQDFLWEEGILDHNGDRNFIWDTELACWGRSEVYMQIGEEEGHKLWSLVENFTKKSSNGLTVFSVPDATVSVKGELSIRLLAYEDHFSIARTAGEGDGYPYQSFEIMAENILAENFQIMVEEESGFVQWDRVNDFDLSIPESRHYMLDEESGKLFFGDCEQGLAPEGKIIIISCSSSLGLDGNVNEGRINSFAQRFVDAEVINDMVASGGMDSEATDQAFLRLRRELGRIERAITYDDYEKLVKATPGLMIQNCRAIPVSKNTRRDGSRDENAVSVVVQPFTGDKVRGLNQAYKENIYRQLNDRHLIGTKVNVLSPEYVGINIFAEILVKPYYQDARDRIEKSVSAFLGGAGWGFGQPVQYSAIYGIIDTLDCVLGIHSLVVDAIGKGITRSINGDVILPPNGMAYLNEADYVITAGE